jgi:hypothetical protein
MRILIGEHGRLQFGRIGVVLDSFSHCMSAALSEGSKVSSDDALNLAGHNYL